MTPVSRRGFLRATGCALAAVAIPGCGSSSSGSPTGPRPTPPNPHRLTARPGDPSLDPTIGASRLGIGGHADGILYVPASYAPDTPVPLLVALHGGGGAATDWDPYHPRAEARGLALLAIDARSSTWDLIDGVVGPDARFLDLALRHAFDRLRVDPARLALAGFSDGATYALSLGPANGDLFSHVVGHSPGPRVALGPLTGRPRFFVSHGTADPLLPVTTTRDVTVPGLRDAGYDVTFVAFGGGHALPDAVIESSLDWFLGEAGG